MEIVKANKDSVMLPELNKISWLENRWVYHPLFWLTYYLFIALFCLSAYQVYDFLFYIELLLLVPVQAIAVYTTIYFLVPRLLLRQKYILFVSSLFLVIFFNSALDILLHRLYISWGSHYFIAESKFRLQDITSQSINNLYFIGLATGLKFFKDGILTHSKQKEKEEQNLRNELRYLKSQIHPHFFFNTLNNLYSLTLKKSPLAPEIVLKLSGLMRYMIYDSEVQKVPLNNEITNLENYIDLEKIRFGKELSVTFLVEGDMENKLIPPLVLIVFAENCFKHGTKNIIGPIAIEILVTVGNGILTLRTKNQTSRGESSISGGMGLDLVRRRLDLLYGANYQLNIRQKGTEFRTLLNIPL